MMAFRVDQVQQACCPPFWAARKGLKMKHRLWELISVHFKQSVFSSWHHLFEAMLSEAGVDTPAKSLDSS
jgi:hypothetical protein